MNKTFETNEPPKDQKSDTVVLPFGARLWVAARGSHSRREAAIPRSRPRPEPAVDPSLSAAFFLERLKISFLSNHRSILSSELTLPPRSNHFSDVAPFPFYFLLSPLLFIRCRVVSDVLLFSQRILPFIF